jgi:DNA-directed RNA polymerases I, II, and III subunit RPABC4
MSREQYTPPNTSGQNAGGAGAGSSTQQQTGGSTAYGGFNLTGNQLEDTSRSVGYLCGDCDMKVVLKKSDPIRCKECGYRVLYKERTNR